MENVINHFPSFFRSTQSHKGYWAAGAFFGGKKRSGRTIPESADKTFVTVWEKLDPIFNSGTSVNIWQFLTITSVIINETGGTFVPISEKGDLKYMYGTNGGSKKSYNTYKANKNFLDLLNDDVFVKTHNKTEFDSKIIREGKTNRQWKSNSYPDMMPVKPSEGGIISEGDFYKFRGRGLIQTTFRDNYLPLIEAILAYKGTHPIILGYQKSWITEYSSDIQKIATASTNKQWDDLFMETDMEFAALALKIFFDQRKGSLDMKDEHKVINGQNEGSLYYAGLKVGGTESYGRVLRARVLQMFESLKKENLLS